MRFNKRTLTITVAIALSLIAAWWYKGRQSEEGFSLFKKYSKQINKQIKGINKSSKKWTSYRCNRYLKNSVNRAYQASNNFKKACDNSKYPPAVRDRNCTARDNAKKAGDDRKANYDKNCK